jgi:hypothetical protein
MDKKDSQKKVCDCNQGRLLCSCKVPPAVAEYAVQKLADLKAQPSGVVLSDDQIIEAMRKDLNNGDGGYLCDTGPDEVAAAGRALIAEVARLNSPPVSAGGVDEREAFYAGVKAASDKVKSIVADYDERHGSTDPDTGTREYPGNGEEWVGQMMELIEDFTGIVAPADLKAQPSGVDERAAVCWVNDQQLLLCSKSPREDAPNNPMLHGQPRNIAGSSLRTDYCNTPLYAHAARSAPSHGEQVRNREDWGVFASYLLDKCEGETISEEFLQKTFHSMFHDPHYGALFRGEKTPVPTVEPAHSDVSVPRETLAMLLKRMERDWALIDSEWGPSKLGLDGEIEKGNCPEIAELRALLNGGQE